MNQLQLVRIYQPRRTTSVPTPCPFTVGKTVRNTRRDETGQVLEQLHHTHEGLSWWSVRVRTADRQTSWLASLCEVA